MYTKAFKALMVRKMADPGGASPHKIAKEIGVSRSTLYRWSTEIDIVDVAEQPDRRHSPPQCKGCPP
jgi:transposase-like protein